ncbi:DUF4214 domain-containing protein [Pseudoduganella namucuonensis]|uniref:DUF4214 domain-containing protein n=1 Tax=Pseudoduganella namucuonensis TaxID=1035707 RepID=A0A1I7M3T5_9BURK|nr:DUF4214 domain-containing protein [Pseudoduganella namucuonensis]SFV16563.1 protein of unknown function [Pseudoduganella namucuonensis]
MTTVAINLSQAALDNLAAHRAQYGADTLASWFDQFIKAGYRFAADHYYYDSIALTPPTGTLTYADGARQTFTGLALDTPGAASGSYTAATLEDTVPNGYRLLYEGQLKFGYTTTPANGVAMSNQGGQVAAITLQTMAPAGGAQYDNILGNTTATVRGALVSDGQRFSGAVGALEARADKFLVSSGITGGFQVSGDAVAIGQNTAGTTVGGTLATFAQRYADGSAIDVRGALAVTGDTVFDERVLSNAAHFSGNDDISVTLPATLATPWVVMSGEGDDKVTLTGGGIQLSVYAGNGDDTVVLGNHNHAVDGGAGLDTVIAAGGRGAYAIAARAGGGYMLTSLAGGGADTLAGVERLTLDDASIALDIDGSGGQAYRLYQAAFDRAPDSAGLGYWIKMMDNGLAQREVARHFAASAEFQELYGVRLSNSELVNSFYRNALHREPDQAGYEYWLDVLNRKLVTAADMLAMFSESPENQHAMAAVIGNGFAYTPYG